MAATETEDNAGTFYDPLLGVKGGEANGHEEPLLQDPWSPIDFSLEPKQKLERELDHTGPLELGQKPPAEIHRGNPPGAPERTLNNAAPVPKPRGNYARRWERKPTQNRASSHSQIRTLQQTTSAKCRVDPGKRESGPELEPSWEGLGLQESADLATPWLGM